MNFLSPFHVLDLTDAKGSFCAKILGDLGARITRIESRDAERDLWWWAYNSEKDVVQLDIEKERERVISLVREADFLIESFPPGYLDRFNLGYSALKQINPSLIMTSITPFGQTGPYKDFKASDLEIMAMSGFMYLLGDQDRPPVRIGAPQAYLIASAEAAVGTLVAHHWRGKTGEGQHVDDSAQESVSAALLQAPFFWAWFRKNPGRTGPYRFGVNAAMFLHPLIWRCKDGHIGFMMQSGPQSVRSNNGLLKYMVAEGDVPDFVANIKWGEYHFLTKTREEVAKIWEVFARFFMRHTRKEIYEIALKEKVQLFPVDTVADILQDEQLAYRRFWRERRGPDGKRLKFPGPLARVTWPPEQVVQERKQSPQDVSPFGGIRVADFSWVAAAPWTTQWLAEFGAEVIKVESNLRVDATRQTGPYKGNKPHPDLSGNYYVHNGGKKSITLNLNDPKGQEIARRLVAQSDLTIESFAPGKMQEWGLSYDELRKVNPQILMVSSSMLGATGPQASQPGLGFLLAPHAGFTFMTGWADRDPVNIWAAYTDVLASRVAGAVLLAALDYKRRTGKGCYIDMSQFEASLQFLSPLILEYQTTGDPGRRMGNRSPIGSPHGVFPCKGEDRWCALSVFSDDEWKALSKALGHSEWISDPKFSTLHARKEHEDELEELIARWTSGQTAEAVMLRLQAAGVNAGIVQTCEDLYHDPQLSHRKHFVSVPQRVLGEYDYARSGFRLEKLPEALKGAPCLGEHNAEVYKGLLGLSDEELKDGLESGVFR